jgi:hypothetical protein
VDRWQFAFRPQHSLPESAAFAFVSSSERVDSESRIGRSRSV